VEAPAPAPPSTPAQAADAVEGYVQDPEGRPIGGADVTCAQGETELTARTDDRGFFELAAEAAGCKAVAKRRGFAPSLEEELRRGSGNRLRLRQATGIAGTVVDPSGLPVMAYWIGVDSFTPASSSNAADAGALARLKRQIDDPEGAFELPDLGPGRYELAVSVTLGPMSRSQPIQVTAGTMTKARIVAAPGVTVSGYVTDAATKAPIDGAQVFVLMGGMSTKQPRTVGGAYLLDDAPLGRFDLRVFAFGYSLKIVPGLQGVPGGKPLRVDVALDRAPDTP
jgi:hypothetical protein